MAPVLDEMQARRVRVLVHHRSRVSYLAKRVERETQGEEPGGRNRSLAQKPWGPGCPGGSLMNTQ